MIFGDCPYCDKDHGGCGMPDVTPSFVPFNCESCGKKIWMLCSRVSSEAYTAEDFEKEYIVDEEKRTITKREDVK